MIAYPLLLEPQYDSKIWGGRRLQTVLGKTLPLDGPVGESLESGDDARVVNGPLAGMTLREVIEHDARGLLGSRGMAASHPFGDFPLLVKFIDASDVLSLQLHPDDTGAEPLGKRGKTEAWYIVEAQPGSSLITGMSRPANPEEVRASIENGSFEALLERRVVTGGEPLMVPAGTMHAIGEGVLLYEIQQSCDVTFRLYDWGRVDSHGRPRDLHLEQALVALRADRHAVVAQPLVRDRWREVLAACRYFALERWQISSAHHLPNTNGATFRLLSGIQGQAHLQAGASSLDLSLGQTVLLPADMPEITISGTATLLCGYIPDLRQDIAAPLLATGHPPERIARLAGDTGDLDQILDLEHSG